jgi:MFS family permease
LTESRKRAWLADIAMGGVVGGIIGAIVAVNFVIYAGIEGGYEATIPDVFRQNVIAGVITVVILASGPLVGVVTARRLRGRRGGSKSQ